MLLAAALLGVGPVLAAAAPADGAAPAHATAASWMAWAPAWLAELLPSWLTAASETEPPAEPPAGDGLQLDDPQNLCTSPDDPDCTSGDGLPDFDPLG
ncbi:MAG TPA: hypothetical protein VHM02_01660 [Thermoanaerobaculia bacterium]|nr:hypothetical protein [Thermoanaerobaculia bacterium]